MRSPYKTKRNNRKGRKEISKDEPRRITGKQKIKKEVRQKRRKESIHRGIKSTVRKVDKKTKR